MRLSEHRVYQATNIGSRLEYGAETGVVSEGKGTNNNRKHKIFTRFFASSIYTPL